LRARGAKRERASATEQSGADVAVTCVRSSYANGAYRRPRGQLVGDSLQDCAKGPQSSGASVEVFISHAAEQRVLNLVHGGPDSRAQRGGVHLNNRRNLVPRRQELLVAGARDPRLADRERVEGLVQVDQRRFKQVLRFTLRER